MPGFGGGYGCIGDKISDFAKENQYSFLFCVGQDTYEQKKTHRVIDSGDLEELTIGGTNARLYKGIKDFKAFFDFIEQRGYKNVIMISL